MALLDATPKIYYSTGYEKRWAGFAGQQTRALPEVRLQWACDDTAGESIATTYVHEDGTTCSLIHKGPDIAFDKPTGIFTAIYRGEGSWA